MRKVLLTCCILFLALLGGCNYHFAGVVYAQTYTRPSDYPGGTALATNPGQVTYYFQTASPQGTVNTSNSAIGPCAANCMQWVSGDQFVTSWLTGVGAGSGGNIYLGAGVGTVNTSGTAVTWVSGTPFTVPWSGNTMTIAGVAHTVSICGSTTSCTLTVSAGTLTGAGYSVTNAAYGVAAWNSATVATLMTAPGTQTGVPYINRTACKPVSALDHGSGCQNSVSHDPALPGYIAGTNLITQISDQTTAAGVSVLGSPSGGDNDRVWSKPNETYYWATTSGGTVIPMQLTVTGSPAYIQVVNSAAACPGYSPPQVLAAGFSTGWRSDSRYYYMGTGGTATTLYQADLVGTGCTLALGTPTALVDFEGAGVCPGIPAGLHPGSIMGVGGNGSGSVGDDSFTIALIPGGQGSGDWVVSWSKTRGPAGVPGCWAANLHTGQWWAFCGAPSTCNSSTTASGTMASGSTNCWGIDGSTNQGIHNVQTDGLALYALVTADMTPGSVPTNGGCSGISVNAVWIALQIGTGGNVFASSLPNGTPGYGIGNHQAVGITNVVSQVFSGYTRSPMSNLSAFVQYRTQILSNGLNLEDQHNGLPVLCNGSYSDNCPFIGASDTVLNTQLAGCTGSGAFVAAVYCPTAYSNMVLAMFPFGPLPSTVLTFAHTGSCGGVLNGCADQIPDKFGSLDAVGVPSPWGDKFCWGSSMWHQLGYDLGLAPAEETFCIYFGPGSLFPPAPAPSVLSRNITESGKAIVAGQ